MIENNIHRVLNLDHFIQILARVEDLSPKIPLNQISLNSRFKEDLGFDSLALMILFVELQPLSPSLQAERLVHWHRVEDCLRDYENPPCK